MEKVLDLMGNYWGAKEGRNYPSRWVHEMSLGFWIYLWRIIGGSIVRVEFIGERFSVLILNYKVW